MRNERVLALVVVLALGGGAWLATQGSREGARETAEEVSAAPEPMSALEDSGLAALPSPGVRRQGDARPGAKAKVRPVAEGRGTLALRLVARETKVPLAGVKAFAECEERWDAHLASGARATESRSSGSDADGRLEIELCAGHEHQLRIDPLGQAHVRAVTLDLLPFHPGERRESEIELETRDDLRWFGRVVDDATGEPIAGAIVAWTESWPLGAPAPAISGGDGVLALPFASWKDALVRITHPGFCAAEARLGRGHEAPAQAETVRLLRPARLAVRVRDGLAAPLCDLAVELHFDAPVPDPRLQVFRGRTDQAGTCVFEELPPRVGCQVVVRRPGEPTQREGLVLEPGQTRELVFEFGGGCTLRGRAQDGSGAPLAGLDLWRLGEDVPGYLEPEHERSVVDKVRCDADGRFAFEDVPSGTWWIGAAPYARRSGGSVPLAARVVIAPGERVHELTLTAPPGLFIRGLVHTEARQAAEALVTATRDDSRVEARSDARGRFVLGPLPAGEWLLEATPAQEPGEPAVELHGGLASSVKRASVKRVRAGAPPLSAPSRPVRAFAGDAGVDLCLRAGGGLSGIVVDPAGIPAARAQVEAVSEDDGSTRTTECDQDGAFRFPGLLPGRFFLRACSGELSAASGPERVDRGEWSTGLELRLSRSGAR